MKTIEFKIEGMSCGGCSKGVTGALMRAEGIESAEVSHVTKGAKVEFNELIVSENDIFDIIRNMNYVPSYL